MRTKKIANVIFAVFFTMMFLLTLFAKDLYHLTLPKVAVEGTVRKAFSAKVTGPDGQSYETKRTIPAIRKEALRGNTVYVVNDTEEGLFLVEREIETGEEADGFIEVTGGVLTGTLVVIGSDREVRPGQQVLITDWNEAVALHTARERGEDITGYAKDMRKRLNVDVLCVVGAALMTIGVVLLCRRFCKDRWRFLKVPVLILWCVLVCLFLKATILLPGEWIPGKLIYWDGWRVNMKSFPL